MANTLTETFLFLDKLGVFDVVLPFILIYVVSFGVLQRVKLWGKEANKNYDSLLSFAFAFFSVYSFNLMGKLPLLFSRIGILFVFIIILQVVAGVFNFNKEYSKKTTVVVILIYFVYIIIDVFFGISSLLDWFGGNFSLGTIFPVIIAILMFFGVVRFVTHEHKGTVNTEKTKTTQERRREKEKPKENTNKREKEPHRNNEHKNYQGRLRPEKEPVNINEREKYEVDDLI